MFDQRTKKDAVERAEAAEAKAELSKENADELQKKLTDQLAATAASNLENETLKAQLEAAAKAAADANEGRTSSDGNSGDAGEGVVSKKLPGGLKTNLALHVVEIFQHIKFINDDTLDAHPSIMADTFKAMGLRFADRAMYLHDTKKQLKYMMSQRRAYCKKVVMKRYKGE